MLRQTKANYLNWEDVLASLIEALPDVILVKDAIGRYLIANGNAKTLLKLHSVDWQGKTDKELVAIQPEMCAVYETCLADDEAAWNAGSLLIFDEHVEDTNGNKREYEVRRLPLFNQNNERLGLIVVRREVTDIKVAEHNQRIADTAIESLEAIVITDSNNRILRVNRAFTKLTGYSPEEVIGKTTAILKSGRHGKAFYKAMWKTLFEKKFWQGEIWDRRKNGDIYPKWLTISAVTGPDGNVNNYVGAFVDLSERKEAKETIHHLAFYDPLTDLPNRRLLCDNLNSAIKNSVRGKHYGAALMIDLDHFKLINDTKGHAIGDLVLVEVGKRLKSCVRQEDTVARLGGDEFVVILEPLSNDVNQAALQAEAVSKKIMQAVNKSLKISEYEIHSSLSIGICIFTLPASSGEEILKRADAAMYQAKSAGRNTVRFFDADEHASLEKHLKIVSELHLALPENQLKLHYQPQVDHQRKVLGAEVLLRWEHPQHGLVPPNEFISFAEESGLIIPIGEWVLNTACLQLKKWEINPLTQNLVIAVNVSARQFAQDNFVSNLSKILVDTKVRPSHLKLELTESSVLQNISSVIDKMEALKLLGINFSIDDFGTGYSSLSYLTKLPISQLKIDRSFVSNIDKDHNDAVIAQTIIGMAKNLDFNVIAEGVETENQRVCLEKFGCSSYQGYLFSQPLPLIDFEKLLI